MESAGMLRVASGSAPPRPRAGKNAGLVMGTNNSSIVSKRSVERLYHAKPHFFQYFVRKPRRRSPTINRGYWLRMQAIDRVVRDFLHRPTEKRKVIINLGCGYDPLPFQWLAKEPDLCQHVQFVDVDHRALMMNKARVIHDTTVLNELVKPKETFKSGFVLTSEQYHGIACDLADIPQLDFSVKCLEGLTDSLVLCLAEVSITYMQATDADALLAWSKRLSDDVTFGLLEQFLPDGADHPFAKTMLRHFEKLQTPLRSIHFYPDRDSQCRRFYSTGWKRVDFVNLWELWSDSKFLQPLYRSRLDRAEPFDEWEEFALFAAHYFLLTAHTNPETSWRREFGNDDTRASYALLAYRLKWTDIPNPRTHRLHGAALTLPAKPCDCPTTIAHIGGMTGQGRTSDNAFYMSMKCEAEASSFSRWKFYARQGHTITRLKDGHSVLVGGRASPTAPMQDCYLQTDAGWERVPEMPSPRFRHCAAAVTLPGDRSALLVLGGKSGPGTLQHDAVLWDRVDHWRSLIYLDHTIEPRFAASIVAIGDMTGLVFGGMGADGVVLPDVWKWELTCFEDRKVGISFTSCQLQGAADARLDFARFGACTQRIKDHVLVIGGISSSGYTPYGSEVLSLDVNQILGTDMETYLTIPVTRLEVQGDVDVPRPMLFGHTTVNCENGEILILGGGAVCFSFGTYWNSGLYSLCESRASTCTRWMLVDNVDEPVKEEKNETKQRCLIASGAGETASRLPIPIAERVTIETSDEFLKIIEQSRPLILEELDLGPCKTLWTNEYLTDKIGCDRPVVVHEARGKSMSFQRKDFRYVTKAFGVFVAEIQDGSHQYLRSISSSNPTKKAANLELDFPEIESDFQLPPQLSYLADRFHSSPLRITGDVAMWLHVDTMANVLCQIAGSKRLLLFPPEDMVKLDFPPGSTTSNLEIFQGGVASDLQSMPEGTHPVEAVLRPGDVLFIPPLWAHTAAPLQGVSIAINVFFHNLSKGYAAGKDIYGNRDLAAYENGRRDVAKMIRAFDELPADLARGYLLRLADELRVKATNYGEGLAGEMRS